MNVLLFILSIFTITLIYDRHVVTLLLIGKKYSIPVRLLNNSLTIIIINETINYCLSYDQHVDILLTITSIKHHLLFSPNIMGLSAEQAVSVWH